MKDRVIWILSRGIIGGVLVGFLIGAYVVMLTEHHVIQRDDYVYPIRFEQAESRYGTTVLFAFVVVFAAIGPFVAAASFGPWIRHAVYGLTCGIAVVAGVALVSAIVTDQQPFNMQKGSKSTCIDIARIYTLPVAIVVGPAVGILTGALLCRRVK